MNPPDMHLESTPKPNLNPGTNPADAGNAATSARKIRVLVVDDHPLVRVGLRTVINAETDMEVVAEAGDGATAIASFTEQKPDITLMDLRLPGMSGPEIITHIRALAPEANVIVLTTYDADEDVYRAVQAGARGYLLKGTFAEGMLDAIRHVHAGRRLMAPEVAARLADRVSSPSLTTREVTVLELVAKGMSNREIGAALFLSEDTIKTHLRRIYAKMGVGDRTEAALLAVQRGVVKLKY
jgi:two-component system NarL family response regulator